MDRIFRRKRVDQPKPAARRGVPAGGQTFKLMGANAFTGQAGALSSSYGAGFATVSADMNGNRTADFALAVFALDAAHPLAAADFVL